MKEGGIGGERRGGKKSRDKNAGERGKRGGGEAMRMEKGGERNRAEGKMERGREVKVECAGKERSTHTRVRGPRRHGEEKGRVVWVGMLGGRVLLGRGHGKERVEGRGGVVGRKGGGGGERGKRANSEEVRGGRERKLDKGINMRRERRSGG